MVRRSLAILTLTAALGACANNVGFQDPAQRQAALAAFHSGTAVMTCGNGLQCGLRWGAARSNAQSFAQARQWDNLAELILSTGYDEDLAWYYLAEAAQGLGDYDAARVYYNTAASRAVAGGNFACSVGIVDTCDGVTLPNDAEAMLAELPTSAPHLASSARHSTSSVRRTAKASTRPPPAASAAAGSPASTSPAGTAAAAAGAGQPGWVAPVAASAPPAPSTNSGWVAPVASPTPAANPTPASNPNWVPPVAPSPQ
jgi:hypothetical protein